MNLRRVDFDEFATRFCGNRGTGRDDLLTRLRSIRSKFSPHGYVLLECADFSSEKLGEIAVLPYGGKSALPGLPTGPLSPTGSAMMYSPEMDLRVEDLPIVYKVDTDDGIPVDQADLPCGISIRHGDELVLTGRDWSGQAYDNRHVRVARILPDRFQVWLQGDGGVDEIDTIAFPYAAVESVAIYERHWDDPTRTPEEIGVRNCGL